jgi:hypothetical protein
MFVFRIWIGANDSKLTSAARLSLDRPPDVRSLIKKGYVDRFGLIG